jgi:hypothetical protein
VNRRLKVGVWATNLNQLGLSNEPQKPFGFMNTLLVFGVGTAEQKASSCAVLQKVDALQGLSDGFGRLHCALKLLETCNKSTQARINSRFISELNGQEMSMLCRIKN